ncbi:hypothetical protein XENTR_v10014233 [Xenopus tropicalis]|uniref:Meiosis-specific 4 homolog (S. cerevisiae) n=1 Tax=Xenopus tropicalis TaxID=8364 RepID=A0A6I8Q0W9_XENTR|nr:meiosis-specific protein MEI4 [Xenopus tropicalis]KAE8603140.1 hypothetical protein XENTR_v10014233 [Xenopus tropicalis]
MEAETHKWHMLTAKVALAIAIIRSKPQGKTSREYTEELRASITNENTQNVDWKAKVCTLEAEVLQLRQQLLLQKIQTSSDFENESFKAVGLEPLQCNTNSGQTEDDSGCELSNEVREDILKAAHNSEACIQSCFPSSSIILPTVRYSPVEEEHMTHQIQFLNHLLGFGKLTATPSLSNLENECNVVEESVSGLLNGLLGLYKNPKPSVSTFQAKTIGIMTTLLKDSHLSKNLLKNCVNIIETFENRLVQDILSSKGINRFQVQQLMTNCIILLGECQLLRGPLINILLCTLKHYADGLLLHCQNQSKYDISEYENMFSILSAVEALLQYEKENPGTSECELYNNETKQFLYNLDQTILSISDDFPLFSLYLWRLGTLCSYLENIKSL